MFKGCTALTTIPNNFLPNLTTHGSYSFLSMFENCTALTTVPNNLLSVNNSNLYLADHCYDSMFKGCISLANAPELPVTLLKNDCYTSMFYGCTSLTTAPVLPATTLQ